VLFRQLNNTACYTYLIGSAETQEAILVDPVLERIDQYLEELAGDGLHLRYAINTHTHADHLSGVAAIADRTGAKGVMHRSSPSACVDLRVEDGSQISVGDVELEFLHTPGHTPDSITIRLPDRILTGDAVFIGSAGRTDLPGGDPGQHYHSLFEKLAPLQMTCSFSQHTTTRGKRTRGWWKRSSRTPFFKPRSRDEYVAWLQGQAAETPEWMVEVLKANYACTRDPRAVWIPVDAPACVMEAPDSLDANDQVVRTLTPAEVKDRAARQGGPLLLDVREPDEYVGPLGHVEGAHLIPLGSLAQRLDELEADREIITICRSGGRSAITATILMQAGFSKVWSMDGGMTAWNERGYPIKR
jgi:glyoxylase-like metal-dependent hydrolase (beta-lactamase superfamily II)/rhodanese-related sulfurtransferase